MSKFKVGDIIIPINDFHKRMDVIVNIDCNCYTIQSLDKEYLGEEMNVELVTLDRAARKLTKLEKALK